MTIDFSRWAVVAYNDDTGLGRMAQDIKAVLGVRQLVIPSNRLQTKALVPGQDILLNAAEDAALGAALDGLAGLILLEKPVWHPGLIRAAQQRGIRLVCVPMWEWFRGQDPVWAEMHAILCPSRFALEVVRRYGWSKAQAITWTLNLARFPAREINGRARVFFHNAGLVDEDDRKGTRDTVAAFCRLRAPDLRLIVRLQKEVPLPSYDDRVELRVGNLPDPSGLYTEGDVAVQPSKMEGVGFMVLEPVCCGIPTITTDYPPMSDYVTQSELRVRKRWFRRRGFPARAADVKHAHLRLPDVRDLARRMAWCAEQELGAISRANRARAEWLFDAQRLRDEWSGLLSSLP